MQEQNIIEPISVTIDRACDISGLGRTSIYDAIKDKRLESTTVGRRRLIVYSSLKALILGEAA